MRSFDAREHSLATKLELDAKSELLQLHEQLVATSGPNWDIHQLATLSRQSLSRILYWDNLYRKIIDKAGIIIECGVQFGSSIGVLTNLRGIYEPYNFSRKIIGFDTFEGFIGVDKSKDPASNNEGDYATTANWETNLQKILDFHRQNSPLDHVQESFLIKGDAIETVPRFLEQNPHQIIAMAIFDMDIFKPTKMVLEAIKPRLMKGSILVFDEFNCDKFPGETQAVMEVLDLKALTFERHPHQPYCAFVEL